MIERSIYAVFGFLALILIGEFMLELEYETLKIVAKVFQSFGALAMFILLPYIYVFVVQGAPNNWNVRRLVFHLFSWFFFLITCLIFVGVALGWWSVLSNQYWGWIPSATVCATLAAVLMVCSYLVSSGALESAQSKLRMVLSMNVMLVIAAALLALLAELNWQNRGYSNLAAFQLILSGITFLAALFNTHGLGGWFANSDTYQWSFFQPFVGGAKFVSLQVFSWVFFGFSLACEIVFIAGALIFGFELFVGVTAFAGICCVVSELLLIVSIFTFEGPKRDMSLRPKSDAPTIRERARYMYDWVHSLAIVSILINMQFLPAVAIFPIFLLPGISLVDATAHWASAVGVLFLWPIAISSLRARENDKKAKQLLMSVSESVARLPTGANSANGYNTNMGKRRPQKKSKKKRSKSNYTRARGPSHYKRNPFTSSDSLAPRKGMEIDFSFDNVVLFIVASMPAMVTVGLVVLRWWSPVPPWTVISISHFLYIGLTYSGSPELTGCRELKEMKRDGPVVHHIGECVRFYFQGSIIKEADLSPKGLYLFGFHPHGVVPITLFWLKCCADWERLFPGVTFSPLTASVMHLVPAMRDVLQWMGGREVSKETIIHALRHEKQNLLIVPGGQAEMLESNSTINEIAIVTRHCGFIRIAMQEGAQLVPVLSFGEVDLMDNVKMPTVQRWFLKRVGIALPHNPYGLWGLPIPRPKKVTVVVCKPITVPHLPQPTAEDIKMVLSTYMCELYRCFEKHKGAAGEGHRQLVFADGLGHKLAMEDVIRPEHYPNFKFYGYG